MRDEAAGGPAAPGRWHWPLLTPTPTGVRTPAKLNLTLAVHGRRPDGYHEISSLMVAIDLCDAMHVRPRSNAGIEPRVDAGTDACTDAGTDDRLEVQLRPGLHSADVPSGPDNLVLRAAQLLRRRGLVVPPLEIVLEKEIPAGAGLGGGSGNAAGLLALLAARHGGEELDLPVLAAELGSDVPFFLGRGAAIATGRGERLAPAPTPLFGGEAVWFVVLSPGVSSPTAEAYRRLGFNLTSPDAVTSFDPRPFSSRRVWTRVLRNDLERPVLDALPELRPLTRWLDEEVPGRWRMTGSGSSFYVACFGQREAGELAAAARRHAALSPEALSLQAWVVSPIPGSPGDVSGPASPERT